MDVTKTTTTKQMNSEMNANNATTLHPTTWEELRTIIEYELERQGQDADLNHIDVSGVTDMSDLFRELDIRHIKSINGMCQTLRTCLACLKVPISLMLIYRRGMCRMCKT